jgi:N-dimethylarginine dimethylaminohydrolase
MFATNEYGRITKVVLCKPENVELHPINPTTRKHLDADNPIDVAEALREHDELVSVFHNMGTETVFIDPDPRFPFQAYTRDLGVATANGMLMGQYALKHRQGEHRRAVNALIANEIPIFHIVSNGKLEGGDIQYVRPGLMAIGCAGRSDPEGIRYFTDKLAHLLDLEVFPVYFNHDFVHLDMVANIVGERIAVCCPEVVPHSYIRLLKDRNFTLVEIPPEDISRDAANVLALDETRILSMTENADVNQRLRALGLEVIELKLTELLKIGGGPHCLTLPAEREGS